MLAASTVLAIALAPALRITRTALLTADRLDRQERCLTVANDRIEFLMARTVADWDALVGSGGGGAAGVPGYPGLRTAETVSDAAAAGGVPGRLTAIGVTAWYDDDGDGALDAGEPHVRLNVLVARLTAYELHAAP